MCACRSLLLRECPLRLGLWLIVAVIAGPGCGGKPKPSEQPPGTSDAAAGRPAPSLGNIWEGKAPPIPEAASQRFVPLPTLTTQRIDKATAPRRIGDLAVAASKEIAQIPVVEVRATQLASLCAIAGPNVEPAVVDRLAQMAFDATGQMTKVLRLQGAYDDLAKCLAHASSGKRAGLLAAIFQRAAQAKELSVFTWPMRSAGAALAQLSPAEAEPIIALAERMLPGAKEPFQREQLLSGMAAAGTTLPLPRAVAILGRAEAGVAGPAHAESRPVFLAELAESWVRLAGRQTSVVDSAAKAILRLETTPYDRVAALGKLVESPGFAGASKALAVLELIAGELPKLPFTERAYLRRRLIAQASKADGGLDLLKRLVASADPEHAYRVHVVAVRNLAAKHGAVAVQYADAAIGLLDKLPAEPERNFRQVHLFRALQGLEPKTREPLLGRLERRAASFKEKRHLAWTLRQILELRQDRGDAEGLRLQGELMRAVEIVSPDAAKLRLLEQIHAMGITKGPASADGALEKSLSMTNTGAGSSVWYRFVRAVSGQPLEVQKRWLPRLLPILVDRASAWRPEDLASRARLVARLAPKVMPRSEAEALLLQVWRVVERAPARSAQVETQHVVRALRAIGVGLATLGSSHFPVLVRRLLARIPRRKTWSEPLMSEVTSLGCLLAGADADGLQKRLAAWVALGTDKTQLIRRGAIVAGLVSCHGSVDEPVVKSWLSKGAAELTWDQMSQFLIRLPIADLQAKAVLLPERRQRIRMFKALIDATIEQGTRALRRWRERRARPGGPSERR